jgi:hypothetical protein
LLERVCIMVGKEGEGFFLCFGCQLFVELCLKALFYNLYGFVCLDFVVGNGSYKFVTFDAVCICVFS